MTIECTVARKHHGSIMGPRGQRIQEISKTHNVTIKIPERSTEDRGDNDVEQQTVSPAVNGHAATNGSDSNSQNDDSDSSVTERIGDGDVTPNENSKTASVTQRASRRDSVLITGRKENCEAAKAAILALVPIVVEVTVPFEYHGQLIGQKGKEIRQIMEECEVTIIIPKPEDHSNVIKISGPPSKIPHAEEVIKSRVQRLEDERKQRELRNFRLEMEVASKHHTKLIGRRGAVVNKIRADHDVQIIFPDKDKGRQDIIVIIGFEENATKARDEIMQKVQELEDLHSVEVHIDHRIHSRLIGSRGRAISKLMEDFKVDIRMPGRDAEDPDLIVLTGREDDVLDCRDHLLNLEEEYLQDVKDDQYVSSAAEITAGGSHNKTSGGSSQPSKGFIVRDAPWSQSYTHNAEDFPNLATSEVPVTVAPTAQGRPVWPVMKR